MKKVLIKIASDSLGDTIACVPYIEEYRKKSNCTVYFHIPESLIFLFVSSYKEIYFVSNSEGIEIDENILLSTSYTKNLQLGFAEQLGFENPIYIKPILNFEKKERPVKNKFIAIGTQSTCQMKYWNHPLGTKVQTQQPYWDELCKLLRKKGYTPVCIDKFDSFGSPPLFNNRPKNSVDKTGLKFDEVINFLLHSEFYIGLSSGLSWLAHALGKKVVMISNFTESFYEFDESDEDYIRISDTSVCHGCFNKIGVDYEFDVWNWYWCPKHENTERQFECHKVITPDIIINKIQHLL